MTISAKPQMSVCDAARLFRDIHVLISTYVYLSEGDALILALFVMLTWVCDSFRTTPYLLLESATKGCGKTTLMEVLARLCCRSISTTSVTQAVLFRLVEKFKPTLFIDEAECLNYRSEINAVANAGYKRGNVVYRTHPKTYEPEPYETFGPKVIALIGKLGGPIRDRCISIHMQKPPGGTFVRRIKETKIETEARYLKALLQAFADSKKDQLSRLLAEEPEVGYWTEISGRQAELFGPLLTIARLCSAEIEETCRMHVSKLLASKERLDREDSSNILVVELVEALEEYESKGLESFRPGTIWRDLARKEIWGAKLEKHYGDKSKAMVVAHFLNEHLVPRVIHTREGSVYSIKRALEILKSQMLTLDESREVTL